MRTLEDFLSKLEQMDVEPDEIELSRDAWAYLTR